MRKINALDIKVGMFIHIAEGRVGIVSALHALESGRILVIQEDDIRTSLDRNDAVHTPLTNEQLETLQENRFMNFGDNVTIFETMYREDGGYRYTGRYLVRVNGERTMYGATLAQAIEHARLSAIAIA